ncbi:Arginine utilization regulatory protein RocR [anaerobic digester metagenome]
MLVNMLNWVDESMMLYDENGRIYLLNDAAEGMDSIVTRDVLGSYVADIYHTLDGTELATPRVLRDKKPLLNLRQHYATCYGKNIDIVTSCYPIVQNGQVLGAFNVMKDWSAIDSLHKQIIDLQQKLVEQSALGKQSTKSALTAKYRFKDIIYISFLMRDLVTQCKQVAKNDSSVLIYGETGTGKELFAQSIHNASRRASAPFLAINCAALPENLLEGILFGTEKGAYTGAERRPGLFEQADGGTLLLDEINSMNISLQSKLLRVLQDGMVRRIGGTTETHVDVRVLSNINIPPYQAIAENKLRCDLFYRLGVVNVNVPPLRDRKEDIPLLAKTFIMQCNKKLIKNVRNIDNEVLEKFKTYSWPGNVRELQHAIEHAMNVLPDDLSMITPEYLPWHILSEVETATEGSKKDIPNESLNGTMQHIEYEAICTALRETNGNISEAARILKMRRQNLQYRIKRHQIDICTLMEKKG